MNYNEGKTPNNISDYLIIPLSTVYRVIKQYKETGKNNRCSKCGDKCSKFTIEEKQAICSWVDEDTTIKLRELQQKIRQTYNINVHVSNIDRILKKFHFSMKRLIAIPMQRNLPQNVEAKRIYARNFYSIWNENNGDDVLFLDEAGFQVSMRNIRGRSRSGTVAFIETRNLKTKNLSLCAAIKKNGVFAFEVIHTPYNRKLFGCFIEGVLNKLYEDALTQQKFIMDNVALHKTQEIREIIESRGHQIIFLPPYSPFLNPIENVFSKWKGSVIDFKASSENELIEAINNS
jgi:transposase